MVRKVLLELGRVVPGVAFATWVVPFHMMTGISYQDIGDSSLSSYLTRKNVNKDRKYVSDIYIDYTYSKINPCL